MAIWRIFLFLNCAAPHLQLGDYFATLCHEFSEVRCGIHIRCFLNSLWTHHGAIIGAIFHSPRRIPEQKTVDFRSDRPDNQIIISTIAPASGLIFAFRFGRIFWRISLDYPGS